MSPEVSPYAMAASEADDGVSKDELAFLSESNDEAGKKPRPFGDKGKRNRVVLLVTAPISHSFRQIVRVIGHEPPASAPVDWDSHDNNALPTLESRLKFTTHYALCVIDTERWEDPSLTLLDKFMRAKFWDHPGDATKLSLSTSSSRGSSMRPADSNAGVQWDPDDLRMIDSGEEIGRTDLSDEEITKVYLELRRDWKYMPVFWNCHDLAVRLGHLVVSPSMEAVKFLRRLIALLQRAYSQEISWFPIAAKVGACGWGVGAIGAVAAIPPLAAAGAGVFMLGWSVGFFGPAVQAFKVSARHGYMRALEEHFPALKALHS
ncbi:hypothetical protein BJY00DRAFT_316993 [Aspergillus carlsbadensis]|nr:hypothetical protein BJY00DRAFT_316993 [Aspergillus carlsbadensis]